MTYWDMIDFPDNRLISFESGNEEYLYLMNAGVMKRTQFTAGISTGNIGEVYQKMQYQAFEINNNIPNETWFIAQPQTELVLNKKDLIRTRALNVELHNSLPVPGEKTRLEDILEFKNKRSSELNAFSLQMDDFYQDIIKSQDEEHALQSKINRIQQSLTDLTRVMDESYLNRVQRSLNAKIDLSKASGAFGSVIAGSVSGLYPMTVGVIGGISAAAFAGVRLSADFSFKPKEITSELKPYAYLYEVNKLNN
ncbi:DUF6236 family protein [Alkalicoccobacillus gibsonii]|uniref:DUF6236 family protein n=1 Tax=Alkalicoccobacillus gibsonii TaxID=79881 RepID=UPI00358DA15C